MVEAAGLNAVRICHRFKRGGQKTAFAIAKRHFKAIYVKKGKVLVTVSIGINQRECSRICIAGLRAHRSDRSGQVKVSGVVIQIDVHYAKWILDSLALMCSHVYKAVIVEITNHKSTSLKAQKQT